MGIDGKQAMSERFRKKPVVIEALLFTGENHADVARWSGLPELGVIGQFLIETLEGTMEATTGDWIIRGVKGEFYPCKPDIFAATYEPVERGWVRWLTTTRP